MRYFYGFFASAIMMFLAGCAHIPDSADIPSVEPYYILQNVRCEIKQLLIQDYPNNKMLRKSSIAYGLTLTSTETAEQSASLDLLWLITKGNISLGTTVSSDRTRKNEGITNIAEGIDDTMSAPCDGDPERLAWKYPITGEIGMRKVIRRYLEVNRIAPTDPGEGFKQTLTFRLKFGGSLKPGFELVTNVDPTAKAPFSFKADREDTHELIVTMAPEQPKPDKTVKVFITNLNDLKQLGVETPNLKGARPAIGEPRRSPSGSSSTQQRLLDSIERTQQRQRFRDDIREQLR